MIEPAFNDLISRYAGLIRSVARRACGDLADLHAADIEQEVRLAVWKYLGTGKSIGNPYSFLVSVATRIALRFVRKARRAGDGTPVGPELAVAGPGVEVRLEIRQAVAAGLAKLSPKRHAAVRAYVAGMSHEEIARFYGWTRASARHAVYDGLAQLRALLQEQGIDLETIEH